MRFSEFFELNKSQPYLDFVDVRLDTDVAVFIDPSALRGLRSVWGHECASLVKNYFEVVLSRISSGKNKEAIALLSCLNEGNEFHLGYSSGRSRGHAFGEISAGTVWGALSKSDASISGLLQDLEDTCLLIDGIGPDMISDAMCNILRGPLIKYTQDMCVYYGVPLTPDVESGPVWNPEEERWERSLVPLPMTSEGKVILVPKVFVRRKVTYRSDEYYTHYLLPEMQDEEIRTGSTLVHMLKNGEPRVTKKDLRLKYGSDKLAIVKQTLRHPHILDAYKNDKEQELSPPMGHFDFSEVTGDLPDWSALVEKLQNLPVGVEHASEYECLIEEILSALFYPALCKPVKQSRIHEGRKRVDITYLNEGREGFFAWLSLHFPSSMIFVECKNYGREIGNPEVDQLAGRFSMARGKVGFLVCRGVADEALLGRRCRDTALDDRGFILTLTDDDILGLIDEARTGVAEQHRYRALRNKFNYLQT